MKQHALPSVGNVYKVQDQTAQATEARKMILPTKSLYGSPE